MAARTMSHIRSARASATLAAASLPLSGPSHGKAQLNTGGLLGRGEEIDRHAHLRFQRVVIGQTGDVFGVLHGRGERGEEFGDIILQIAEGAKLRREGKHRRKAQKRTDNAENGIGADLRSLLF
jgi:hypothetical protein